jgi:chemotaxis signal transduction protein
VRLPRYKKRAQRATGYPVILFTIGDNMFAIGAANVNEIQGLQEMHAIGAQPRQFGKVRHTITREGHRYWVVDGNVHFGMMPTHSTRVLLLGSSPVALKVDGIVRMTEIPRVLPLPQAFHGEERNWYIGLALVDSTVVPVVNPEAFLSHYEMSALEQSVPAVVDDAVRVTA